MKRSTIGLALGAALTLVACGGYSETIQSRERAVKSEKSKLRSVERKIAAHERYRSGLSGKGSTHLVLGRAEILESIKSYLPYTIPGKTLWPKRLTGSLTLKNARNIKILRNNKAEYQIDFKGKKIKVNLKGTGASASHERQLREVLEGGGTITVTVAVSLDLKKKRLVARPKATKVKLRKHNNRDNRKRLKDVINKRILAGGKVLRLPKAFRAKSTRLITTKHHFVLVK